MITAKEYAEKIGYSPSAVTKKLLSQKNPTLPETVRVKKFGNTWLIELKKSFNVDKAKKSFKTIKWR